MDLLYGLLDVVDRFMAPKPAFPLDLLYLFVVAFPLTLLHELGHAVAARRLLGGEVDVSVGSVGRVAELRLGEIKVSLNAIADPTRAAGLAEFDDSRATARDVALIALAGPAFSLAGTMLTGALLAVAPAGELQDVSWAATALGLWFALFNAVPFSYQERRGGPSMRTDGKLALDALRVMYQLR